MKENISVENIEGPWKGDTPTGLLERCKHSWHIPLHQLTDVMVVTFLNQNIATKYMLIEAKRRLKENKPDDTELFEGQLEESVAKKENKKMGTEPANGPD